MLWKDQLRVRAAFGMEMLDKDDPANDNYE
jgi:hypothetical protein